MMPTSLTSDAPETVARHEFDQSGHDKTYWEPQMSLYLVLCGAGGATYLAAHFGEGYSELADM
jgi:hypothetical protein